MVQIRVQVADLTGSQARPGELRLDGLAAGSRTATGQTARLVAVPVTAVGIIRMQVPVAVVQERGMQKVEIALVALHEVAVAIQLEGLDVICRYPQEVVVRDE